MLRHITPFLLFFTGGEGEGAPGGGTNGNGGEGGSGGAGAGAPPPKDPAPEAGKTFTQAEVDRIAGERARRERAQFSDYDDLKAKADKFDAAEEAKKTDAQKEADARAARDREDTEKSKAADRRLINAEIKAQAAGRVHDLDVVVTLLASDPTIKVKGDDVQGAKEALDTLLEKHPYLLKKDGPGTSGGEFGGVDRKTIDEQIAAAEAAGDWKLSSRLKMQKARAGV